jgi:endo-1,4-beta-xylanase
MTIEKTHSKIFRFFNNRRLFLFIILILFISLTSLAAIQFNNRYISEVDWLNRSDWSHFSGAEKTDLGVKIFPTGRVINHSDTSKAQPNPPVNIRGSVLRVSGDFEIEAKISGIDNEATVQFYGQVPVIYDEWRQERTSIRITASNKEVYVQIWDGTAANSIDERRFYLDLENEGLIGLAHRDGELVILANGKSLGEIPDHNIFSDGKIWFGADAKSDTEGWSLLSLTAIGINKDTVELIDPLSSISNINNPKSLRNLSEQNTRNIPIGAAISVIPLFTDAKYNEIALSEFSMMTPENSFKPQVIHPLKDLYLFNDADSLVEAAQNNQMIVHGHSLVMGKANPEWMQKTPENERKEIMTEHVTTIVSRYKGDVAQWDVVNEPMSEDAIDYKEGRPGLRKHMWLDAMGEEYIDIAYKAARAADPNAKLYLNDFGLEKDGERWDAFLNLVKRLQSRGVPIDGVGFESHVYHSPADDINPAVLKSHIQTLATLGLESRISEIDVLGDDPTFQAQQYSSVLQVCISEPTCTSYGIWGITDLYGSTTLSDRYPIVHGDSLIWGLDYAPKPALESLLATLKQT